MKPNSKISAAVAAVLSAPAASLAYAAGSDLTADQGPAQAQSQAAPAASDQLQEVIVTANRREQNLQDVPITVQALTGATLAQLNVSTIDDFVKYLPSVSTGSMGPGQSTLFMRGLSVGVLGTQGQGSVGGFPNVAVYLDDQSGQLPGRNLDVYAADLERIEVLEGPQGTLFGAGAEAGVIRYITNKPKLDDTEGSLTASYGTTAHGDDNSKVEAVLNLPVIADTLAVRMVVYDDNRGGYINNVPSTFARSGTDLGLARYNGGVVPTNSLVINNYNQVQNAINPLTYQGFRVSALLKFNDNWNALLVQSYQNMNAQGVFYEMPNGSDGTVLSASGAPSGGQPLPPLSVTLFNPNYTKDRWENTALTVNGQIGDLKFVYTGSYLDRNIDQQQDYTNYARGVFGYYYQCAGYSKTSAAAGQCYTPSSVWTDQERNTHLSQEMRLSTPDDWRIRGLVGIFYEDLRLYDDTEWLYKSVPDCSPGGLNVGCYLPIEPWPGAPANDPNIRNSSTGFFDDFQRGYTQDAAFASIDFDVLPKVLTITAGTRWYDIHNETAGGDVGSFYCKAFSPTTYFGVCGQNPVKGAFGSSPPYGTNLSVQDPNHLTATGFRSRANISWHVTPDFLLYYTWSQGYRPGGFNRGSSNRLPDASGVDQYATPKFYVSDSLTNDEVGWKTLWWDHRIQFNGAIYQEDWSNTQVGFFCPQCGLGNLTYGTNGPDYRVRGVEMQIVARLLEGFTIQGSASWNSTQQTNSPSLIGNIPGTADFGKPLTQQCPSGPTSCIPLINVYGPEGSPLANSPPFQANLRGRYEWPIGSYDAYAWLGGVHQAHSLSATGNVEAYDQPGWTTYDGAIGIGKDAWTVEINGQNLTDVNTSLFTSSRQFIITETPMRPRTLALQFTYSFGGASAGK